MPDLDPSPRPARPPTSPEEMRKRGVRLMVFTAICLLALTASRILFPKPRPSAAPATSATPASMVSSAHPRALALAAEVFRALPKSAAQAANLPDAPEDLQPGLTLKISSKATPAVADERRVRVAALTIPEGAAPTPYVKPGPLRAVFTGNINRDLREEWHFFAEGRGKVEVKLNGNVILSASGDDLSNKASELITVNKDANPIEVTYDSPDSGEARIRIGWFNDEYVREPLPPEYLTTNAASSTLRAAARLRAGRELFADNRCLHCHKPQAAPDAASAMPELAMDAPDLSEAGARLRLAWLARWIENPHAVRADTPMPRIFADKPFAEGKVDQRALDVAAYIASLGAPAAAPPEAPEADDATFGAGGRLFTGFGCVGCHTLGDHKPQEGEIKRISLASVHAKFQPGQLAQFLLAPEKHFAWIRMPNFRLSDEQAKQLAAFIDAKADEAYKLPEGMTPNVDNGKALFASAGCANCHDIKVPAQLTAPALDKVVASDWKSGCLAPSADARRSAPDFSFDDAAREALIAFAGADWTSLERDCAPEAAERQMRKVNCFACHARDGQEDPWTNLQDEINTIEASLPAGERPKVNGEVELTTDQTRPSLTWTGEKLHEPWMAQFISGQLPYKPRPWIYARMPGFKARGALIAQGLAEEHGMPSAPVPPAQPDPKLAEQGRLIAGKEGGLGCISCHAIGDQKPVGVFESQAVNFRYVSSRLRREYYWRWIHDPVHVQPGSKMPKFADNKGKISIKFFDGDSTAIFDALWNYLQTGDKIAPPPMGP